MMILMFTFAQHSISGNAIFTMNMVMMGVVVVMVVMHVFTFFGVVCYFVMLWHSILLGYICAHSNEIDHIYQPG
jgi:hypothetical protein